MAENLHNGIEKHRGIHRFYQKTLQFLGFTELYHLFTAIGCNHDNCRRLIDIRMIFDLPGSFETVDSRQFPNHNDQFKGMIFPCLFEFGDPSLPRGGQGHVKAE